jgi:uncharacterized protein (DUF2147 family)
MEMFATMKNARGWRTTKVAAAAIAATVLFGAMALLAPSTAVAKTASNTFTFKGVHSGTLELTPSSMNCSFGKSHNGKSYLVTLSHMKGTISGAGTGPWAMTAYVSKQGKTHVVKANVHSLTDTSFQSNAVPMIAFDETSGTVTDNGSTGSISISVEYHAVGSTSYSGSTTITGSWNCPEGLNLG